MKPKYHLLLGTLFSIIFYLIHPKITAINFLLLWLSTWLIIDADGVPYIISKAKTINPRKFFNYYNKRKEKWESLKSKKRSEYKSPIRIFHNLEFLIILLILGNFFQPLYYIFIGFLFHLIFDCIHIIKKRENVLNKVSLLYTIITNKNKKEFKI